MHHANMTFCATHTNLYDHHQLYPIPIALSAQHHIVDLAYDLQTTLLYFPFLVPFQLPDAPCCRPTSHKPLCLTVRALLPVLPHTNLVLIFVYHLYLSLLYLPLKRRKFSQEFGLSLFCLIAPLHTFTLLSTSNSPHTLVLSCTFVLHCLTLLAITLGDCPYPFITPSEPHWAHALIELSSSLLLI